MFVRIDKSICGERFSYNRHDVVDIPKDKAQRLIRQGRAHALDTEQASKAPAESAMKRQGQPHVVSR